MYGVMQNMSQTSPSWELGSDILHHVMTIGQRLHVESRLNGLITSCPEKQHINQLEAVVPIVAMLNHPSIFENRDFLWGVDNSTVESVLIRGYSSKQDTAAIVAVMHLPQSKLNCRVYWFHVDSKSNPSDGLSRDGHNDEWVKRMASKHSWELVCPQVQQPFVYSL